MERFIYPNEQTYADQIKASGNPHHHAEIVDELKAKAKAEGLWNLFLPEAEVWCGPEQSGVCSSCRDYGSGAVGI